MMEGGKRDKEKSESVSALCDYAILVKVQNKRGDSIIYVTC